jgi:hypothetical protein
VWKKAEGMVKAGIVRYHCNNITQKRVVLYTMGLHVHMEATGRSGETVSACDLARWGSGWHNRSVAGNANVPIIVFRALKATKELLEFFIQL